MNKAMYEAFKSKIDVVDSIRGGISDDAKDNLAKVLNNTKNALNDLNTIRSVKNESVLNVGCDTPASQYNGIDWFPEHSIDMVSAIYASQIIDDLVSVQAIDSPLGVIRFLQYVYGTERGAAGRGEVAIDEWGAMRGADNGKFVARERIDGELAEPAHVSGDKVTIDFMATHLPIKYDADAPIIITNEASGVKYYIRPCGCKGSTVCKNKLSVITVDGHETDCDNVDVTVDVESGQIKVVAPVADVAFTDGEVPSATYFQDLSHVPTDSMNLELRLKTEMIKAVPHKIRANFSFDASYALSKAHGINVEEALVNACTAEIRQERDNEVIDILRRQAGNRREWDRTVTSYISQHDHDLSFLNELFACASLINFETKRGFGNWVVVGRQGLNIIKSAGSDHFKPAGATLPNNGAFVVGELDGQMKVIYSPYVPQDSYLVGYKGGDMDAGFVVADFLPITKTELVMLDDFVGRRGLVSYWGCKMLNPKFYVCGRIVGGDANFR